MKKTSVQPVVAVLVTKTMRTKVLAWVRRVGLSLYAAVIPGPIRQKLYERSRARWATRNGRSLQRYGPKGRPK